MAANPKFSILGRSNILNRIFIGLVVVTFVVLSILTVAIPKKGWASGIDYVAPEVEAEDPGTTEEGGTDEAAPTDPPAEEEEPAYDPLAAINSGDTAWMLISTALVLLMTPGLAFFYGGMVRHKNVISTIMQNYISMGVITVIWVFLGFSLCFGDDVVGIWGDPATYYFFNHVGAQPNPDLAATIPLTVFSMFQVTFAVITVALITGSFAERIRFGSWVVFMVLWHFAVYCPLAHMTWHPKGLIRTWMVMDFAGGTVVHMSSGYCALVGAWYLGPRASGTGGTHARANLPHVLLGAAMLWFGWFGFNAGSAGAANALAGQAFLTTNVATASAMCTWLLLDHVQGRRPTAIALGSGIVVGLVAITPAAGFVTVGASLMIGMIGAICSNLMQTLFQKHFSHRLDDSLDAFPCHGIGGTVGMFLTGCFASVEVNPGGYNGLFYKGGKVFWHTCVVIVVVIPFIMVGSYICFKLTDLLLPLRVSAEEEMMGLDKSVHGEVATAHDEEEGWDGSKHVSVQDDSTSGSNAIAAKK